MTIRYIANDPEARGAPAASTVRPSPSRPPGSADFSFGPLPAARPWPVDSDQFLLWQCREALLRATAMWESIAGPLKRWQHGTTLRIDADIGEELNAYYDRESLAFARKTSARTGRSRRFAASVDVVAHEAGHAFLDAIRPELWDSNLPEPNAFHEAFADCIAILTALADRSVRQALLAADAKLAKANFVETLMESLANGVRDEQPGHNAAKPRRARNGHRWTFFTALADDGPPGALIAETHSYGQVFVGCFYDALRHVFLQQQRHDDAALRRAAKVTGTLLARAAAKAPHGARFFQAVGHAMMLEDDALHDGRHGEAIRRAFEAHAILLSRRAALAPRSLLAGPAPASAVGGTRAAMTRGTLDDLRARLQVPPGAALRLRSLTLGGQRMTEATHERHVSLTGLSDRLAHVVAFGAEPTLVGSERRRAAVLGALPDPRSTEDEVRAFVRGLVARKQIAYDDAARRAAARRVTRRGRGAVSDATAAPTHAVVPAGDYAVLRRIRYACACCACGTEPG